MSGHGSGRRKRHEEHEEHENHERWLVTYADMVTLLMVLFIVMFAMSQVDERKYAELKDGLAAGFGASDSVLDGNKSIQEQAGTEAVEAVAPQLSTADLSPIEQQAVSDAVQKAEALTQQRSYADAQAEAQRLEELRKKLMAALAEKHLQGDVRTTYDERGLVISLMSRHVVFEANLATLSERGAQVVDALAPVLREVSDPLEIDGHTNQAAGAPKYFATDWDLSAARAVTVLRRLNEHLGIPADRLSLAAFGHTKPLIDPTKPGSQAVNKRVDIVVLTSLGGQEAEMLPAAAGQKGAGDASEETGTNPGTETGASSESAHAEARTTPNEHTDAAGGTR